MNWTKCARDNCGHPRWAHVADGCRDYNCNPYRIGPKRTGPPLCQEFITPKEGMLADAEEDAGFTRRSTRVEELRARIRREQDEAAARRAAAEARAATGRTADSGAEDDQRQV